MYAGRPQAAPGLSSRAARSLLITVFFVVWGLITHGTHAGSGDELHYLMMARSLAFDRDFRLTNDYDDPHNLVGAGTAKAEAHLRPGRDGVPRPVHDIGLPLLAAPFVRVMYPLAEWLSQRLPPEWMTRAKLNAPLLLRHQISLLMAMLAGLLTIEIARALVTMGFTEKHAFFWALLLGLSPPLLSFSFLFFTELLAALLVMVSLRRILRPSSAGGEWFLTGLLVGLLTLVHIRNAPLSFALAVVTVVSHHRRLRMLVPFAIGIAIMAAIRTGVNWLFWGRLVFNDHARIGTFTGVVDMVREMAFRASGLFFDQEFGLLTLAPIYLLALAGLLRLWRRDLMFALPITVVVVAGVGSIVFPALNPYGFVGGWSPAPRFIVPVVPLLAVAAAGMARNLDPARKIFVGLLIVIQVAISAIVWNDPKVLWEDGNGSSLLAQAIPQMAAVFARLPTWHGPEAHAWPFVVALMLWTALTAWLVAGVTPSKSRSTA